MSTSDNTKSKLKNLSNSRTTKSTIIKVSNEADEIEPWLLEEPSFHGYIPREDLVSLLNSHGDYLLRIADITKGSAGDVRAEKGEKKVNRELVVSVMVDPSFKLDQGPMETEVKDSMIRSFAIHKTNNRYTVDFGQRFEAIARLLRHYSKNPIKLPGNVSILLNKPIRLSRWEYTHKDISIGKKIGMGCFGDVMKGTLRRKNGKTVTVAMKSLKRSGSIQQAQIDEMMSEARMMRGLSHPNVVKMFGVALCQQPIYLILDFIKGGSLDKYLKEHAPVLDRDEKLQMMMGACWGLQYLHQNGIIHRDIASRNCLYDQANNQVKIGDFGLSKKGVIYKMKTASKMPTKWLAPECISNFQFSQKSDVYSFGILIYEIFSCKESYDGCENKDARKNINEGIYNEFPEKTPPSLVKYVQAKMWNKDPSERATMSTIRDWLEKYTGMQLIIPEEYAEDMPENQNPEDEPKFKPND